MWCLTAFVVLAAAGCSTTSVATKTTLAPKPAGAEPSPIAKQVCHEAVKEIASTPGRDGHGVHAHLGPTISIRVCTGIRAGAMVLSVKELSSWSQTYAYYGSLARQLGRTRTLQGLGQGAFQTTDGSMVVRKDWKVLLVDMRSGLPAQFGVPPTSSADVAVTVADVILGCWAGD